MINPKTALSGIEYLLVCIQANPGRSQRYYLRRLYEYKHNSIDPHSGATNCGYFTNPRYRGRLFEDAAPKNTRGRIWLGWKPKARTSQMHLTSAGNRRANEARAKIGLPAIPFIK